MKPIVVYTDLDGTLLDSRTYSFDAARPALSLLRRRRIPLVLCSSKTRKEILFYRARLHNKDPFVSENGGGVFVPAGYFGEAGREAGFVPRDGGYEALRLGANYADLRVVLKRLRDEEGFATVGFGDMTPEEVAALTGLPLDQATMGLEREFDEPFVFHGDDVGLGRLREAIERLGYRFTRGTLPHIHGESDKGRAVSVLNGLYTRKLGLIVTVAIGDSANDVPMFSAVDIPVLVRRLDGSHDADAQIVRPRLGDGIGSAGWNRAVLEVLEELDGAD